MLNPARILYVEDDDDIRDTMTMLLEHEGYDVTAMATAESALEALVGNRYDLLLTDYELPGANAEWLIAEGKERGCLRDTAVIVLSGTDHPRGIEAYRLLRKPIGQEALLSAFDEAMGVRGAGPLVTRASNAELRLVLYVSGESQASRKAQRNLQLALAGVAEERFAIVVHDVTGADLAWESDAEDDRIVVLPTLVRHAPLPKVWIAGDLADQGLVREAIIPGSMRGLE